MRTLAALLAIILVVAVAAFAAPLPRAGGIIPGKSIGSAMVGELDRDLVADFGEPAFKAVSPDGQAVLYEWGLLGGGSLPDATLWAVVDTTTHRAFRVGTDKPGVTDRRGLGPGRSLREFTEAYGRPAVPVTYVYLFRAGVGIIAGEDGVAVKVWVEDTSPMFPTR